MVKEKKAYDLSKKTQQSTNKFEYKLPVFAGFWFTRAFEPNQLDSCYFPRFEYENKSIDPRDLADKLLKRTPHQSNCTWGDVKPKDTTNVPTEFIIRFSHDYWSKILNDNKLPHTMLWVRQCIKDGHLWVYDDVLIYPSYECSRDTSYVWVKEKETRFYTCTTAPVVCQSDVMGRDMNTWIPIIKGYLGHIGLSYDTSYIEDGKLISSVLEVRDTPPIIRKSEIESEFRHIPKVKYWGSKYNLPIYSYLSSLYAYRIFATGLEQMAAYDPEYTAGWCWHSGTSSSRYTFNANTSKWEQIFIQTRAKFRCDSFVYYSYLEGAKIKLVDYECRLTPPFHIVKPSTIYDVFTSIRPYRPYNGKQQLSERSTIDLIDHYLPTNETICCFAKNQSLSRAQKINALWSLALKNQSSSEMFGEILDALSTLKPLEIIPQFIENFHQQKNLDNQVKLITNMVYTLQQVDSVTDSNQPVMDYAKQAQKFIIDLLHNAQDLQILREAIISCTLILPPEQAMLELHKAYPRQQFLLKNNNHNYLLNNQDYLRHQLNLAFSTKKMQVKYLPDLLLLGARLKGEDRLVFDNSLFILVSNIPKSQISNPIIGQLTNYIESEKQNIPTNSNKFSRPHNISQSMIARNLHRSWLLAYKALSGIKEIKSSPSNKQLQLVEVSQLATQKEKTMPTKKTKQNKTKNPIIVY